jgi:DNA-binding CsgD family transcriptional regulator
VLRHDGKVAAGNRLLEDFAPQVVIAARDFVRFQYAPANDLMAKALQAARTNGSFVSRSFPLPRNDEAPPVVVHLVPVRGNARDIFLSAAFFLIVTPVDRSRVPTAETIQGLFDLTPAEARVARSLAAGSDVAATAAQLSVSAETVRTHVKAILSKSGMPRQTDLVAAIASVRPIE